MDSVNKILEITSRIEQLEQSAEWIAREMVHADSSVSQTGTYISALADDIRERLLKLVRDIEVTHAGFIN